MARTTMPVTDPRQLVGELLARMHWSAEQLKAHQRERLDDLLRHAVAVSPFYRRRLGPDPAGAPLEELPTLSKAALMGHFEEIVTDPRLSRAALQAHLEGPVGDQPLHGHLVFTTSGSTGEPGIFLTTPEEFTPWVAALLRTMTLFGVRPGTRLAGVGSDSGRHISRHLVTGLMGSQPSTAPRTAATTPLPELVAVFNAYQPEAIPGYPSMLALLAAEQLAGRLRIAPRVIAYAGEVLTADMRALIRQAWGVEPFAMYSATEAAMIASGPTDGAGMHLWEDLVLVEVVDEANRPVPVGVPGCRVLLTNLVNRVQPLIRYELTDLVTLAADTDPAGTPFRRIAGVEGRSDDLVRLPGRAGGTVTVHPHRLRAPMAAVPGLRQYQIEVGPDALRVAVVLGAHAPADTPQRLRASLREALLDTGAEPPHIEVTPVEVIPREPGHAGKFKTVKVSPRAGASQGACPAPGLIAEGGGTSSRYAPGDDHAQ